MGVYVFSRQALLDLLHKDTAADFGREVIPRALGRCRVQSYVFSGYWADVGTVESFYEANILLTQPDAPLSLHDPRHPVYTRPRLLPGARLTDCTARRAIITEGCMMDRCTVEASIVGIRTRIQAGARITRSVLLGADFYDSDTGGPSGDGRPQLGIGRDVVLDRVIVDKNARIGDGAKLVSEPGRHDEDGEGYFIRNGVIIVPKGGVIKPGTIA